MHHTFAVYDDYLRRPGIVGAEAERIAFVGRANLRINEISRRSRHAAAIERDLTSKAGARVCWHRKDGAGTFRRTASRMVRREGLHTHVHFDGATNVVGVLYLNQPDACHGGTGFYRHVRTGLHGVHDVLALRRAATRLDWSVSRVIDTLLADANDRKKWELTDLVQMRHNRLLMFNGLLFHSQVFDFDRRRAREDRLTLVFYGHCDDPRWLS